MLCSCTCILRIKRGANRTRALRKVTVWLKVKENSECIR